MEWRGEERRGIHLFYMLDGNFNIFRCNKSDTKRKPIWVTMIFVDIYLKIDFIQGLHTFSEVLKYYEKSVYNVSMVYGLGLLFNGVVFTAILCSRGHKYIELRITDCVHSTPKRVC